MRESIDYVLCCFTKNCDFEIVFWERVVLVFKFLLFGVTTHIHRSAGIDAVQYYEENDARSVKYYRDSS